MNPAIDATALMPRPLCGSGRKWLDCRDLVVPCSASVSLRQDLQNRKATDVAASALIRVPCQRTITRPPARENLTPFPMHAHLRVPSAARELHRSTLFPYLYRAQQLWHEHQLVADLDVAGHGVAHPVVDAEREHRQDAAHSIGGGLGAWILDQLGDRGGERADLLQIEARFRV